jgi:hypothetical protein
MRLCAILRLKCPSKQGGHYFVDNQRFISAAMRSRPASTSASLRRSPNGMLRASAITPVARISQSWLWAGWADIGLGGETIHKSQGSEYPAVVIPVMTQHYTMLQRNLLYTGVTRGKKLVVLVGQKKAVAIAVRSISGRRRWSKLHEWLAEPK